MDHSPFDIPAWKGNYTPYRFDLKDFVPIVAGSHDHLDPSVHCVLAVPDTNGANLVEVVTFNPRYVVSAENKPTYRPPYFHRNGKSEFMTYLGAYDAREGTAAGFYTLHGSGVAHGNDKKTYENEIKATDNVKYLNHKPATMVEFNGYAKYNLERIKYVDEEYTNNLKGLASTKPELGATRSISMVVYPDSFNKVFDYLMPDFKVEVNENTGLVKRTYTNT